MADITAPIRFLIGPQRNLRRSIISSMLVVSLVSFTPRVWASSPSFNIVNVGLTGPGYTRDDGYQYSRVEALNFKHLNEAGQIVGYSARFDGDTGLGRSAWLYDGSVTSNIGLTDAVHTRYDGVQFSEPWQLNNAGQVSGYSSRYNGIISGGRSTWLYDGTSTVNIGLTDAEHTDSSGFQYSTPAGLNNSGQVSGFATRAAGGRSAWFYDGSTTSNIGLTDAEHTRDDGYRYSQASSVSEAGQVLGYSTRYGGDADLGRTAWLFDGLTTHNIGLTGAEHTRDDGYRFSDNSWINKAGQVVGRARRFDGSTSNGETAWLYDGSSTVDIGLTDAEHTSSNGSRSSGATRLNDDGLVLGNSDRYDGTTDMGRTAWIYDGSTTFNIGPADSDHTRDDGYRFSRGVDLNEAGQVIGNSERYVGGPEVGSTAWMYDGTTLINIGLTSPEYTRDDGLQYNSVERLNQAGWASGSAARFDGSTILGGDAWVYHSELGTVPLRFSVRDDGVSSSGVRYLGENGHAVGAYALYSGMDYLGLRAFYWSPEDGAWDLGTVIDGGLSANGWEAFFEGQRVNSLGYISGYGVQSGMPEGSRSEYLLVPVPEPSSFALASVGLLTALVMPLCRGVMRHYRRELHACGSTNANKFSMD